MAIFSPETRISSFMELGRIRKGAPKSDGLHDLTYFRADFRPDQEAAAAAFHAVYGDEPTSINVRLAFAEIERCWMTYYMAYNTSGLLAKAGIIPGMDGLYWLYLRDNKTGRLVVKDGRRTDTGALMPFDPAVPVYSYVSKKGKDVPVFAKPEGRLFVMVPELRRINYMTLVTHSFYDCARLDGQLNDIKEIAERVGLTLPAVPLRLVRRLETVSVAIDGRKHMEEKSLVGLDVDQDWAGAQFALLDQIKPGMALPAPRPLPALPSGMTESDEAEAEDDGPDLDLGDNNDLPAPAPAEPTPLQIAMDRLTPNGTKYGELNDSQLEYILNGATSKADSKAAADLILAARQRQAQEPAFDDDAYAAMNGLDELG